MHFILRNGYYYCCVFYLLILGGREAYAKLLVPNAAAGALIGNSGATIRELMQRFQAEIRLSRHGDYFPGTSERVCVITGDVDNVCSVTEYVFQATKKEAEHNKSSGIDDKRCSQLQMVVSHIAAGMIVGKGGEKVKQISEDSGARIKITRKEECHPSVSERIVYVEGSPNQVLSAANLIIRKMRDDPRAKEWEEITSYRGYLERDRDGGSFKSPPSRPSDYGRHMHGRLSPDGRMSSSMYGQDTSRYPSDRHDDMQRSIYSTRSDALLKELEYVATRPLLSDLDALRPGMAGGSGGYGTNMAMPGATLCTLEVAVPENMMPGFMGRGRYSIVDIEEISGARLDASDQCIPGTMNSRIVIHGNLSTAQAAHSMVMQRIERDQDRRGTY